MITVANRATPPSATLEQQQSAMPNEGAAPEGQEPTPPAPNPVDPAARPTLQLRPTPRPEPGADKT